MPTHSVRTGPRAAALAVILALLAGVAGTLAAPAPAYAVNDGGFSQKMLELVNQRRAAATLAPLQWSESLGRVAGDGQYDGCGFPVSGRAKDMGTRNYFSHTILGCGAQGVSNILAALGIRTSGYGENIAWMSGTTSALVAAERLTNDLMASAGHRANILNPDFTHVGIGSWGTSPGQSWTGGAGPLTNVFIGVQVFGRMTSTPPGAPTVVAATGDDGSVKVTWAPAASGPAADVYGAFAWDGAGYTGRYVTACGTCRNATITGLTNGRTYYVTVYGYNPAGWGSPGYSSWVTVAAVPGPPTEVRAVPGNASLSATWRGPTNPGTAIDGYAMLIFDANGYTNKYAWVCPTCSTASVPGLVNGRSYYAVVLAHNPNGWGTPTVSEWVVAGTPGPPGNVAVTRGNGAVSVSWTAATGSGSVVDLYGMFAFDSNGYTGIYGTACGTCTTGTVAGLTNGRAYTIAVYAYSALGWGSPTRSAQVTPAAI